MQNEAKLESGPIFDFGGPWWPGGPTCRLSKTNTAWPIHLAMPEKKFQSSSINSFGCSVARLKCTAKCCKNNNNNNNNKDSTDFVKIIKMPTEVGIFNNKKDSTDFVKIIKMPTEVGIFN